MQQQGQLVACSEARPEEADSVTDHVHTDNVSQNPYKPEVADFGERLTSLTLDNSLRVIYNPRIIPATWKSIWFFTWLSSSRQCPGGKEQGCSVAVLKLVA